MTERKKSRFITALVIILILIGISILWIAIPLLAENTFGKPDDALTGFQKLNYSLQVLSHKKDLTVPISNSSSEILFEIGNGASVNSISAGLESQALIHDASAFRSYLIYKGFDSKIKSGIFRLSPADNALKIADKIQAAYSEIVDFYIYPGWRAEEIAAALPSSGIEVTPEEFLAAVYDTSSYPEVLLNQNAPSVEGFLFPGEYRIPRQITAEALVITFLSKFEEKVNSDIIGSFESNGLSFYEGIILASIIQKETFKDDERGQIASVFYNRLSNGMKLETDPTVQYALGYSQDWGGWWKTPLMTGDLEVDSPYNTYKIFGLPPTPIANPDLASILAAADPDNTPYFFFRAKCNGSGYHDFSSTFEEHVSKACP